MRPQGIGLVFRLLLLLLVFVAACKRAERYGGIPKPVAKSPVAEEEPKTPEPPPHDWREAKEIWDVPLVFVPSTSAEWAQLPEYWNALPRPAAAVPVAALALSPVSLPALQLADILRVKIKVPLGLPDPTPLMPTVNRPTLARWQLGKELFFDEMLLVEKSDRRFACSTCHQPERGFTEHAAVAPHLRLNTLSLINVVYNRAQFWDGRVDFLEQTIARDPGDPKRFSPTQHAFNDLATTLRESDKYRRRLREVFEGVEPTDAAAKALATYMRTILSGNSIVDRAEHERSRKSTPILSAAHFAAVLGAGEVGSLGEISIDGTADKLELGYRLFTGKASCIACHPLNAIYTDRDFHNIGLGDDFGFLTDKQEGRILSVPLGLKESRLVGAYRTPTLRALPRTKPYMHDGTKETLEQVLEHFNSGVKGQFNEHLARPLRAGPREARKLGLDEKEIRALVLFLQALDGDPVDPVLTRPPAKPKP